MFVRDCTPTFRFFSYTYSSSCVSKVGHFQSDHHISLGNTLGLGHTFNKLCHFVAQNVTDIDMVTFVNGDVMYRFSDMVAMHHLADRLLFNWYQPSLSLDSFFSHDFTLVQPGRLFHSSEFIELMCFTLPYSVVCFIASLDIYSLSGWGMDWHVIPHAFEMVTPAGNNTPTVFDMCQIGHLKRLEEGREKVYQNGLTAYQELQVIKNQVAQLKGPL